MKKTAGIFGDPTELRERFHMMLNTRLENDFEFRELFTDAYKAMKRGDQSKMKKLFVQHAANITQAPNLAPEIPEPPLEDTDPFGSGQPSSTSVGDGGKLVNSAPPPSPKPKKLKLARAKLPTRERVLKTGRKVATYMARHRDVATEVSKTAAVDAWFEKNASAFLTEAQRRYPELLKAAADTRPVPVDKTTRMKASKPVPAQAALSGGAA